MDELTFSPNDYPTFTLTDTRPRKIAFHGIDGVAVITLDFDASPPTVLIQDGMDLSDAAKVFWNAAAGLVGQAPLFPDAT
jgi:hypothetical protein